MIITNKIKILTAAAFTALLLISCSPQRELVNLDVEKKLVQNYYESGQYNADCREVIDEALAKIKQMQIPSNSAVVFDVDETALSNYIHTKEIGFGFVMKLWNEWLVKADAPAVTQTKRFYDWLVINNINVIFLTGRSVETYDATLKNLKEQGYKSFDTLIVRQEYEKKLSAADFKTAKREELARNGYNIIASIGDQWSDLLGENTGIKIKLPNYLYVID